MRQCHNRWYQHGKICRFSMAGMVYGQNRPVKHGIYTPKVDLTLDDLGFPAIAQVVRWRRRRRRRKLVSPSPGATHLVKTCYLVWFLGQGVIRFS
jgi:hypothetical protein